MQSIIRSALAAAAPVALMTALAPEAKAATIVISNDDGLTSNVVALYRALKADGHDVIVAVPCTGQSGMSGAVQARPIGPLAADCLNGAARKGEPGVGPMSREGLGADFHYVAGTPVMALLYGLDIVANARWGKAPDLVLSGPNEGQNLGLVTLNSGTVGIVQASAVRGIPAIALSAGDNTKDNPGLANPLSSKVAQYSVELVEQILGGDRSRRKVAPVLRPGLALNVNFPDKLDNARWSVTRMGTYTPLQFKFVPDLGADPTAKGLGLGEFRLPGLSFDRRSSGPKRGEENDEGWRNRDSITVSVMQAGFGAGPVDYRALTRALSPLTRR